MLPLEEAQSIEDLADLLYDFLPSTALARAALQSAASEAGVSSAWVSNSHHLAIVNLLTSTLEANRSCFVSLVCAIFQQAIAYRRSRHKAILHDEIDRLNSILSSLDFEIPPEIAAQEATQAIRKRRRRRFNSGF